MQNLGSGWPEAVGQPVPRMYTLTQSSARSELGGGGGVEIVIARTVNRQ